MERNHLYSNITMRICQLRNMVIHQEAVDNEKRLDELAKFRKAYKWQQGIEMWYVIESEHYTTITRGVQRDDLYLQQWQFDLSGVPVLYKRWKEST